MRAYRRAVTSRNTRAEIAGRSSVLLKADEWHPLDGVPAPEYIPDHWDGIHAGVRLVEAFRTLSRLPVPMSRKSGIWPEYRHEWADLLAREEADADLKAQDAFGRNRARIMPSHEDVSRMEAAIAWPARYLGNRPMAAIVVQRVAVLRARDLDLDEIARRLKRVPVLLRLVNRSGLDQIASGLRRDAIAVF